MKYDVITFGSATLDIFIKAEDFLVKPIKKFTAQKGICFPFSSKVDVKSLDFYTGGGGTNAAAAFSLFGFKTAYCGMVGADFAGKEILKNLKKFKIKKDFVFETRKAPTNLSIIFSLGRDRTCFVWRGASQFLTRKDIPWKRMKAKWFYLAPLSGKLSLLFVPFINFAKKNNIKVFANLGNSQISLKKKTLDSILKKIDILLLNQEEASLLTNISYRKEKKIFKKLDQICPGIAIMTKGEKGAVVSDGKYVWEAKSPSIKVVEKTGAGDSFGSGFLAGFMNKQDISFSLQLGIANSISCIQKIGAKQGLLKKNQPWKKVTVLRRKLV